MNYTIGMSLPPYVAEYNEPTTCMNGSFYGAVKVKFKESLSDVFLSEFQNRLKIASQKLLWRDGDLNTRMVLFQYKDIDEIWLYYCRRHWWEDKEGDFRIKDHKALTYNEYNAPVNKWENQTDMPNGSETIQTILGKIVTTPQNEKKPEMGNMQESNTEI